MNAKMKSSLYPALTAGLLALALSAHPLAAATGRPATAFDFGGSPSGPGATSPHYYVAYESNATGAKQIWGRLINWNGTIGIESNISADPTVDTKPTVAFKFGSISSPSRNYLIAWERSDGALGYRILDRTGSPLSATQQISSLASLTALHDVTAAAAPQGGWRVSRCGTNMDCTPYLLAYRAVSINPAFVSSSIRLAMVDDGTGSLWKDVSIAPFVGGDDPIYAPHIAYGHSATADYYVLAYRLSSGEIVVRQIDRKGGPGPAYGVPSSASSSGPPVVAYSYANNRWGVFWRTVVSSPRREPWVTIQGYLFDWTGAAPSAGHRMTAVSMPVPEFSTAKDLLPEYSVAGSHTATEYAPFQGLFELAYIDNTRAGEVYAVKVYTGGTLGATTRVTRDTQADRYVKIAVTRIDPLIPDTWLGPSACTGKPGSRCALGVFEHSYASGQDISGRLTRREY